MQFTQPKDTNMPVKAPTTARYALVPPSGSSGNSSGFEAYSGSASALFFSSNPFSRREESVAIVVLAVWLAMVSKRY